MHYQRRSCSCGNCHGAGKTEGGHIITDEASSTRQCSMLCKGKAEEDALVLGLRESLQEEKTLKPRLEG